MVAVFTALGDTVVPIVSLVYGCTVSTLNKVMGQMNEIMVRNGK